MKNTETKISTGVFSKAEIPHNTWDTNPANFLVLASSVMPTQGTADNQRIGNEIYIKNIYCRFMFYTKAEYPNTKFRVIVYKIRRGTNATYANVMDNQTGNVMLDKVDSNKAVKIYDRLYNNKRWIGGTNADEQTTFANLNIRINRKFKFLSDVSTDFSDPPYSYYINVLAYDTYGTILGTTVGAVQMWSRYTWKDL